MKTTSAMFAESRGAPIAIGEFVVNPSYDWRLAPNARGMLSLSLKAKASEIDQGVRVIADEAKLLVGSKSTKDVYVWTSDTVQEPAVFEFETSGRGGSVRIVNVWRFDGGRPNLGRGNSGIVVRESSSEGALLGCSDGIGEFDPTDLTITLVVKLDPG